jgi:Spy/CpxP family protein refolding chaperone
MLLSPINFKKQSVEIYEGNKMKKLFTSQILRTALSLFMLLFIVSYAQVYAQTAADEAAPPDSAQGNQDAGWASALGLTPEQIGRIRAIRQQNRVERQATQQRLHQAQRALDQAIYSDDVSEALIEQRSRELAEAQAAEVRLRAMTELSIRRVLTPQQLNTFRTIREQRIREAQQKRRMENPNRPGPLGNRRLENGLNLPPGQGGSEAQSGGGPGGREANPALGPRQRRGGLPRRIRP